MRQSCGLGGRQDAPTGRAADRSLAGRACLHHSHLYNIELPATRRLCYCRDWSPASYTLASQDEAPLGEHLAALRCRPVCQHLQLRSWPLQLHVPTQHAAFHVHSRKR